jgi:hypothetical protein
VSPASRDDAVIFLLFRALAKSVHVAEPSSTLAERKEMIDCLIALASEAFGNETAALEALDRLKIGERVEEAMDRLGVSEPLRVIRGGRD